MTIKSRAVIAFFGTLLTAQAVLGAGNIVEITLPGTNIFPESITSKADGTLIVGSMGHGNILRIAAGKTDAKEWIKPGTGGLNGVFGVFADDKHKALWACSNKTGQTGEPTSLMRFDLSNGTPKGKYSLPGEKPLCNDIAVAADGTAYITDTRQAKILMLKPGASELQVIAEDQLLAGADGIAFGDITTLYVNAVFSGKLLRLELGPDGKSKRIVELKLSRPLERPDGMRTIGPHRLLLAENSGKMSVITITGPEMENAEVSTIKEGMASTPAVTATKGMAWIAEGKLNYRNDPALKDSDAGLFKMYAVPLPRR